MIKATLEKDLLKLSNTTLDKISGNVKKPLYDRARLKAGIVHIGLGNFHRASLLQTSLCPSALC